MRLRAIVRGGAATAVAAGWLAAGLAAAADYSTVTDERLRNPEPHNWLSWRGNDAGWGYSSLEQINRENVGTLVPVWSYSTGVNEGHQAPPIVNDGVMFVSTPQNQVIALDAATGREIWRYVRALPEELFQLHPTNRGVALYGDRVYMATVDACLVALDAKTGEQAWENCVGDWKNGEYSTLAPLVVGGNVLTGVSGGEYGIRGFITAVNAETGKTAWQTYTVPGPGEKGHETWQGDAWKTGGASIWMAGSYDPETGLAYYGTGNGGPWMPDTRPGDNLYATSVIAIDVKTGEIKGHHQYHWNDAWDWDEVSAPLLMDIKRGDRTIKGAVHAGRNGYLWVLERTDGPINFVDAKPYVRQNVFSAIDPKTGRPTYDPDRTPGTNKTAEFCPSLWGGKDWPMEAYNPKTKLFYIPVHENLCTEMGGAPMEARKPGELWIGVPIEVILSSLRFHDSVDTAKPVEMGGLQAWDLETGKMVWKHGFMDDIAWGPLLTTGGGLVFAGGTMDRKFRAFDAETGKVLWEFPTNSGVTGAPSSYEVDGVQYIAVQSGWGVDAERMRGLLAEMLPKGRIPEVPQGGVIWVFALKDKAM
jgi:alcohol dehydrogenase (cytochrome c)